MARGKVARLVPVLPMGVMIIMMLIAVKAAEAHDVITTVIMIGLSLMTMYLTVGSRTVNAIDVASKTGSTAFIYGIYNGVLNLMGAANSIIFPYGSPNSKP